MAVRARCQGFVKDASPGPRVRRTVGGVNDHVSRRIILRASRSRTASRPDRLASRAVTTIRVVLFLTLLGLAVLAVW